MEREIRIGIIGAGMISREHIEHYLKIPHARVVALCDTNPAALRAVSEQYGISDVCTDFRALLRRDDIDAVDVCLHANLHAPVTIEALRAGKHVYCEKPLAGSYADGEAMLRAAEESGKLLHIQLRFLYRPDCRMAKQIVDSGALGNLYHLRTFELRRRGRPYIDWHGAPAFVQRSIAGGGALMDLGVYHISRMLYLTGCPRITRVSGEVYQQLEMDEARRKRSGYDVEETAVGFVHFENNVTMDLFDSWAVHLDKPSANCILGSLGGLRLSPMHPETADHSQIEPMQFFSKVAGLETNATICEDSIARRWVTTDPDNWVHSSSQEHWIGALLGKTELIPTAKIALDTCMIQEGIYLSAALGREVTAAEIRARSRSTMLAL